MHDFIMDKFSPPFFSPLSCAKIHLHLWIALYSSVLQCPEETTHIMLCGMIIHTHFLLDMGNHTDGLLPQDENWDSTIYQSHLSKPLCYILFLNLVHRLQVLKLWLKSYQFWEKWKIWLCSIIVGYRGYEICNV